MTVTENWIEWYNQAKSKPNAEKAIKLAQWLVSRGYGCALMETDDGVVTVTYGSQGGEGHVWPSIRINGNSYIFPKGTPMEVMNAFFGR